MILEQIKGDKLSKRNYHLGNQWEKYKLLEHNPEFCVITLGSNNIALFQKSTYVPCDLSKRPMHWAQVRRDLGVKFGGLKRHIDSVLQFLFDELPGVKFLYVKIQPQHWWGAAARTLARWLDFYITCRLRSVYKVGEIWNRRVFESHCQFDEQVMYLMLKRDMVHYNHFSNKAIAQTIMRMVLNRWRNYRENAMVFKQLG